jgi:D-alanyl-D-alanine carboxypeptidase (penicillin-binding protein 5/6)
VLFAERPDDRRPIASITKVMTALLALDRLIPSTVVVVGRDATLPTGSTLGLQVGERISALNLLYALLLQSSNDAAVALADAVAGSAPAFVKLMNERARELGLADTRFTSPNGLDDRGYSSAADLALLTRTAYQSALFARMVETKARDIPAAGGPPRHIQNRNALLWLYPGAIGVKTGFTTAAGHCLVATAAREGGRVIAVVLGERDEAFDDTAALLNYGLLEFRPDVVARAGEPLAPVVVQGLPVPVVAQADLAPLVRRDLISSVRREVHIAQGLALPVVTGEVMGTTVAIVSGREIGSVPLVAVADVRAPGPSTAPFEPGRPSPLEAVARLLWALVMAALGASL